CACDDLLCAVSPPYSCLPVKVDSSTAGSQDGILTLYVLYAGSVAACFTDEFINHFHGPLAPFHTDHAGKLRSASFCIQQLNGDACSLPADLLAYEQMFRCPDSNGW